MGKFPSIFKEKDWPNHSRHALLNVQSALI